MERQGFAHYTAANAILDVAAYAGRHGFHRIGVPYARTDNARNDISRVFLDLSEEDDDTLVMLDGDHIYHHAAVGRLASHKVGVVGALACRRSEPHNPLFFVRNDGILQSIAKWEKGTLYECDVVSTSAIAIKRWVFLKIYEQQAGEPYDRFIERCPQREQGRTVAYPFFQYRYPARTNYRMTEDVYFANCCHEAGIKHHCDTGVLIPHLTYRFITTEDWEEYIEAHPEILQEINREV